jgi:hypothetical protein
MIFLLFNKKENKMKCKNVSEFIVLEKMITISAKVIPFAAIFSLPLAFAHMQGNSKLFYMFTILYAVLLISVVYLSDKNFIRKNDKLISFNMLWYILSIFINSVLINVIFLISFVYEVLTLEPYFS